MSRIGKSIGGCLYVHRQYQNELPASVLAAALRAAAGFPYDVVKWDTKTDNVTFVQCATFDTAPEPAIGPALLVRPDGTVRLMKPLLDPWVYHHKYAFVGPDYRGFDLEQARRRQAAIDRIPDVDKSRIGKYSVNAAVTRGLSGVKDERNPVQKTSVNQLPGIFKFIDWTPYTRNADIGGGAFEKATDFLRERHVQNLVYDPFCRPDTYEHVGSLLAHHPADSGTLANVLNVIELQQNRLDVLRVLAAYTKPGAPVYIGIYEKDKTGVGAHTATGTWQNNWKTAAYLPEVRQVFPDARKSRDGMIVATSPGAAAGLGQLEQFNPRRLNDYKRIQRQAAKPATFREWFAVLTNETHAHRDAYITRGELNLTMLAEWLEDNYDESLHGQDAGEIVFEWAEKVLPVGYEPLAEIINPKKPATVKPASKCKFAEGERVSTIDGPGIVQDVSYLDFAGGWEVQVRPKTGQLNWYVQGAIRHYDVTVHAPADDALELAKGKMKLLALAKAKARNRG